MLTGEVSCVFIQTQNTARNDFIVRTPFYQARKLSATIHLLRCRLNCGEVQVFPEVNLGESASDRARYYSGRERMDIQIIHVAYDYV